MGVAVGVSVGAGVAVAVAVLVLAGKGVMLGRGETVGELLMIASVVAVAAASAADNRLNDVCPWGELVVETTGGGTGLLVGDGGREATGSTADMTPASGWQALSKRIIRVKLKNPNNRRNWLATGWFL